MNLLYRTETLVESNKHCRFLILEKDGAIYLQTETKLSGEWKQSAVTRVCGKNSGKANATSALNQAKKETRAKIDLKLRLGWQFEDLYEGPKQIILPQLAKVYKPGAKVFPAYVQPKLDGIRMLMSTDGCITRTGKAIDPRIVAHLLVKLPEHILLDGELMLPPPHSFQETCSAVKKFQPLSLKLEFQPYDLINIMYPDMLIAQRLQALALFTTPVESHLVEDHESVAQYHAKFLAEGYEGTIVRPVADSAYRLNARTSALLKYKDFLDAEFEIIGVEPGVGAASDHGTLLLQTTEGQTFKAVLKGSHQVRAQLLEDKNQVIGLLATVQYQNLTDGGVPRFPIVTGIRDYE